MCVLALKNESRPRRGTVMVMVIGVLAMLFIIGSTLLIVGRFERQTVQIQAIGRNVEAVGTALTDPIILQLRSDLLGSDDTPYNHAPNPLQGDTAPEGDYADYPGYIGDNNLRNGDLVLSSSEPYGLDPTRWFAASWRLDFAGASSEISGVKNLATGLSGGPAGDADADGLTDSNSAIFSACSEMFGGGYTMNVRVESHGGKVLLDPRTHPALLAQVFHPRDTYNEVNLPWGNLDLSPRTSEGELRRRRFLPKLLDVTQLPASDIRFYMPWTLGYNRRVLDQDQFGAPHWWPFDNTVKEDADWAKMLVPGTARTDVRIDSPTTWTPLYDQNADTYDRRHLVTTASSDDVLRPWRDEKRLQVEFPPTSLNYPFAVFYDILNPSTPNDAAYGVLSGDLKFNGERLRAQFSLRDVLEVQGSVAPYSGTASYRRAMQLTAYFLAMIQHTTVPGSDALAPTAEQLEEQFRTAAQLAVNTLDFADSDQIPTCFQYVVDWDGALGADPVNYSFVGVEKQPYITEAYAKVVYEPQGPGFATWQPDPSPESIYAVELYNPYDVPVSLTEYELLVKDSAGGTSLTVDLGLMAAALPAIPKDFFSIGSPPVPVPANSIPPHQYVVIANRADDQAIDPDPLPVFIQKAVADGSQGTNLVSQTLVPALDQFKIKPGESIVLRRKAGTIGVLNSAAPQAPPVTAGSPSQEVDVLKPVGLGNLDGKWAAGPDTSSRTPADANDRLVRDSSLQRLKEGTGCGTCSSGKPPVDWYFTLSRQVTFPLPWCEDPEYPDPAIPKPLTTDKTRAPQHNLLGTSSWQSHIVIGDPAIYPAVDKTNQQVVDLELAGYRVSYDTKGGTIAPANPPQDFPLIFDHKLAGDGSDPTKLLSVSPFPVLIADRGVDPDTGGTIAFPTTGTLLLVTRHAHERIDKGAGLFEDAPVSVVATKRTPVDGDSNSRTWKIDPSWSVFLPAMQTIDNGHLPVFDSSQICKDFAGGRGRINSPWGQLVFDYFTALPLEERAQTAALWGLGNPLENYPVVSSQDGTKVLGRINVGVAPWWVLDGLPVLPDWYKDAAVMANAVDSLPVPELQANRLDPAPYAVGDRAGAWFTHKLTDEWYGDSTLRSAYPIPLTNVTLPRPPAGYPSISPRLAKYMVSYREERPFDANIDASKPNRVGFASVGELCNIMPQVRFENTTVNFGPGVSLTNPTLAELRVQIRTDDLTKPFGYLGYLQMVAPIVRIEDWVTVKSHVFTVYATLQSTTTPPVSLRTQVTVDRTQCLVNPTDLPERITETPPISYFNAVDD